MNEKQFHKVDPTSLKNLTVNDILTGQNIAPDKIDYSVPIPTHSQSLPHGSRDTWLQVEFGGVDPATLPTLDDNNRGRIGGC